MAFTDHKITAFTHKISDLADQPNLPPDELKARFDACPEELRQAVNAICDDAARLDERVGGIIDQTFTDTITKAMLTSELRSEFDAKATQSALEAEIAARETAVASEAAARASADSSLSSRIDSVSSTASGRCRLYTGTYTGTGVRNRTMSMPATPKAVLITDVINATTRIVLQGQTNIEGTNSEIAKLSGSTLTLIALAVNGADKTYFYVVLA